jgi:hypothetical protein
VSRVTDSDKKYVHAYDYMGRRVRTRVYTWDPNTAEWSATPEQDRRFMYHERKLLLELDSLAKLRKYVWGPEPGSAGVSPVGRAGALTHLLVIGDASGPTDYVCFTDAGGSVVQLLDRADGSIDAKYVCDVSGDRVSKSGPYAGDNPLRYRAMHFDRELDYADTTCDGLYCVAGGNYYSPRLGRRLTDSGALC